MLVYLIMMMEGVALGFFDLEIPPEREALYTLAFALVLTQACIVDSRIAGRPLPPTTYWLVFMLYSIAVPYCIVLARGLRGLVYVAAHLLGMLLVSIISFVVTGLLFGTF